VVQSSARMQPTLASGAEMGGEQLSCGDRGIAIAGYEPFQSFRPSRISADFSDDGTARGAYEAYGDDSDGGTACTSRGSTPPLRSQYSAGGTASHGYEDWWDRPQSSSPSGRVSTSTRWSEPQVSALRGPGAHDATKPAADMAADDRNVEDVLIIRSMKQGLWWRGRYERMVRLSAGQLKTLDPTITRGISSMRVTNSWQVADVTVLEPTTSGASMAPQASEVRLRMPGGWLPLRTPTILSISVGTADEANRLMSLLRAAGVGRHA